MKIKIILTMFFLITVYQPPFLPFVSKSVSNSPSPSYQQDSNGIWILGNYIPLYSSTPTSTSMVTNSPSAKATSSSSNILAEAFPILEDYKFPSYKELGCNTDILFESTSNLNLLNDVLCTDNCNYKHMQVNHKYGFNVTPGSTICSFINNSTEINNKTELSIAEQQVELIRIGNLSISYNIVEKYQTGVNINKEIYNYCHCYNEIFGSSSEIYCSGTDYCQQFTAKSNRGCGFEHPHGIGSSLFFFNKNEIATVYKISSPVYSYVYYVHDTIFEKKHDSKYRFALNNQDLPATTTLRKNLYTSNRYNGNIMSSMQSSMTYSNYEFTSLNETELLFIVSNYSGNADYYSSSRADCLRDIGPGYICPSTPIIADYKIDILGQLNYFSYPGLEYILEYNGEYYYLDNPNGIDGYDSKKFGWFKIINGKPIFSPVDMKSNYDVEINNCGDGKMTINSDINLNEVKNLVKFSDRISKFGKMKFEELSNGVLILEVSSSPTSLMTIEVNKSVNFIDYSYGINNFFCKTLPEFRSTKFICNITYDIGDHSTQYFIISENTTIYENNVELNGEGNQLITFNVPQGIIKTKAKVCFKSDRSKSLCENVILTANSLNITDNDWNVENSGENFESDSISLPDIDKSFDFFNASTWADNILKTIISFVILILIVCCFFLSIVSIIYCMPNIIVFCQNNYDKTKRKYIDYKTNKKNKKFQPINNNDDEDFELNNLGKKADFDFSNY